MVNSGDLSLEKILPPRWFSSLLEGPKERGHPFTGRVDVAGCAWDGSTTYSLIYIPEECGKRWVESEVGTLAAVLASCAYERFEEHGNWNRWNTCSPTWNLVCEFTGS